jgi:hypothetical protein
MAKDVDARFPNSADVEMFSILEPSTWEKSRKVRDQHTDLLSLLIERFSVSSGSDEMPIFPLPPRNNAQARAAALVGIQEELAL